MNGLSTDFLIAAHFCLGLIDTTSFITVSKCLQFECRAVLASMIILSFVPFLNALLAAIILCCCFMIGLSES